MTPDTRLPETDDLTRLRRGIDAVNLELLRLLERRGELVLEIARLKQRRRITLLDTGRELDMLENIAAQSRGLFDRNEITAVFRGIFEASRSLAQRLIPRSPVS
ncbi:MAG TPA: chorismate mutase [Steroidobacteraceae bacterium]|nr:chorismate mutase [Steroidobacteraceae bacterium]